MGREGCFLGSLDNFMTRIIKLPNVYSSYNILNAKAVTSHRKDDTWISLAVVICSEVRFYMMGLVVFSLPCFFDKNLIDKHGMPYLQLQMVELSSHLI